MHPTETRELEALGGRDAFYNLYEFNSFVDRETETPVTAASVAQFDERGVIYQEPDAPSRHR